MYAARKGAKRFSLLLLEEGEDYLQEYICVCQWPTDVGGNWQGRSDVHGTLRLCSKSLFFEADDVRIPVVRIPFAKVQSLEPAGGKCFAVTTSGLTKMKANNSDQPYVFEKSLTHWKFTLPYASFDRFMGLATEQMALKDHEDLMQEKSKERENSAQFDTSRLVHFSEKILYEGPARQLMPLVREPGKLVVTDERIYFQPLNNISGGSQVRTHLLSAVAAVARRRSSFKQVGLEVFFIDPNSTGTSPRAVSGPMWDAPSAFFAFRKEEDREKVACLLLERVGSGNTRGEILEAGGKWLRKVAAAWQRGKISNFDYLLYLNLAAGRTFNDLTQWPVFPWIIADYKKDELDLDDPASFRDLGKPVGALNPERLEMFRNRYREMPEGDGFPPRFLYGTHYTTPGYVMFWLVRAAPAHMLQLQNGRFDAADRLFCNISEAWDSVTNNAADVKELIPEFFLPNKDFLLNKSHLALGVRQNGRSVGDVELPAWAKSPDDFLAKHRVALESPYVSQNLHKWIDLIFGCKQRGDAAVEADNLFYYLSYGGAVDLEQVNDPLERQALEAQINEFGQTPMQLFTHPHPRRLVCPPLPNPSEVFRHVTPALRSKETQDLRMASYDTSNQALSLALLSAAMSAASSDSIDGTWDDWTGLGSPMVQEASQVEPARGQVSSENAAGETQQGEPSTSGFYPEMLDQWSFLDRGNLFKRPNANNGAGGRSNWAPGKDFRSTVTERVKGLNTKFSAFVEQLKPNRMGVAVNNRGDGASTRDWSHYIPHRLQTRYHLKSKQGGVNGIAMSSALGGTLYCAGQNANLRLFSLQTGEQFRSARLEMTPGAGLPLSSIALMSVKNEQESQPLVLIGSYDNSVYAYSSEYGRLVGYFNAHDNAVSVVKLVQGGSGGDRLVTASWDCSVRVWSLDEGRAPWGTPAASALLPQTELADHDSGVWAMDISPNRNLVVTGTDDGDVYGWDLRTPSEPIWNRKTSSDYIGGVRFTPDGNHLVVTSADGKVSLLSVQKNGQTVVDATCGSPLRCCESDGLLAVTGSEKGKVHVWNVGQQLGMAVGTADQPLADPDGWFDPVNCASETAINALAVGFVQVGGKDSLWTVAGHEDGDVTVFGVGSPGLG